MPIERRIETVFHLLDERNWPSVQKQGLLSAQRLLENSKEDSTELLRAHRPAAVRLSSGAWLRDQRPMPPAVLARYLADGVTPADWFALLNSKVFFWIDPERLNRQRLACGEARQIVLVVDAARLLEKYATRARVTPINTGNALRAAARRNLSTFVPYDAWVASAWQHERIGGKKTRPDSHRPSELTIEGGVEDVMSYVVGTRTLEAGESFTWRNERAGRRKQP